jgi:hypothetical protein
MHYEMLSRALAYVSCLSTMSLFLTAMAIAAVNVGKINPQRCGSPACAVIAAQPGQNDFGGLMNKAHVEAVAATLWSKKI